MNRGAKNCVPHWNSVVAELSLSCRSKFGITVITVMEKVWSWSQKRSAPFLSRKRPSCKFVNSKHSVTLLEFTTVVLSIASRNGQAKSIGAQDLRFRQDLLSERLVSFSQNGDSHRQRQRPIYFIRQNHDRRFHTRTLVHNNSHDQQFDHSIYTHLVGRRVLLRQRMSAYKPKSHQLSCDPYKTLFSSLIPLRKFLKRLI